LIENIKIKNRRIQLQDPTASYVGHVKINKRTSHMKAMMLDKSSLVKRVDHKIGAHHVEHWSLGMLDLIGNKEFFAYHYFDAIHGWCTEYIQITKDVRLEKEYAK